MDEAQLKALCGAVAGCVYSLFKTAKLAGFTDEVIEEEARIAFAELEKQHGKL